MAAALALLVVLALVAVAVEVVSLRPRSAEIRADQAAQSEVVRAAERFTVQVNTYDAGSMDSYQSAMNSMMSPKFRADYRKVIDQLASTIKQAKVSSKGDVLASAVASVDTDSAQVLVVSDASVKTIYDPNPRPALPVGGLAGEDQRDLAGQRLHSRRLMPTSKES